MVYLLIIGLIAILGQSVLLRELSVAFYGVDLIYTLALGIWLLWTALGAMIGRRKLEPSHGGVCRLFLIFSLLLPVVVLFIRVIRPLFSDVPGTYLPFAGQVLVMSTALLPIGILSGLLFQWAARLHITGRRTLAGAYAIEGAGGLAGGLCATLLLKFGVQNFSIAIACAAAGLTVCLAGWRTAGRRLGAIIASATFLLSALLILAGVLDWTTTMWNHPDLVAVRDTPYCRVAVELRGEQIAVYENDALSFQTEGVEAEELVHLAALLHGSPKRVLILGGGIEGFVGEALQHAPAQVDYVELNQALLDMVTPWLPLQMQEALHADAVHVTIADPRRFLETAGHYDLILIGMPAPESGPSNRFYTIDFFQQCAAHLNPEGILAFRLRTAENLWTPLQTSLAVSIYRALKGALPQVRVLPGSASLFVASRLPLPEDPALLGDRFEARGIKTRLVSRPYIRYLYTNERYARIAGALQAGSDPLNSDNRPICYQYTIMIWLSKFYPSLAAMDASFLSSAGSHIWLPAAVVAVTAGLVFWGRRRDSRHRVILAGFAGYAGMVLETVLILRYQVKRGVLFQDIGLLLMSFMAGLALGALATDRRRLRLNGRVAAGALAVLGMLTAAGIRWGGVATLAEIMVLQFATGFLGAALFAHASQAGEPDQRAVVSPLYAADLLGGCIGSLAASLLLIPAAGLDVTTASIAPPAILILLLFKSR